jgi:glycosyltransferase involved in cell wall biosynthesis
VSQRNADAREVGPAQAHLESLGIRVCVVDSPVPAKSGLGFYARLAGNLASALPYSVASHTRPAFVQAVRALSARERIDLWHCEWTPYAQPLAQAWGAALPQVRWTVMAHNVESLIWQRYAEMEPNTLKRWYIREQGRKFVRFERWAYRNATQTIAVSPADATLIGEWFGANRVTVVDNGVDPDFFRPGAGVETVSREPGCILFLGSLDWRPNLDAVQLLLHDIYPRVRAQQPEARVCIVGRNPPAWLRDYAAPGVSVHANVADVRPFLAKAGVLAVPLRIGGGSRLKILEALASGTPVLSTTIGAEGLNLLPDQHLTIADTPANFAHKLLHAIRQPDEHTQRAAAGRRQVLAYYDWDFLADKLDQVWCNSATPHARARARIMVA